MREKQKRILEAKKRDRKRLYIVLITISIVIASSLIALSFLSIQPHPEEEGQTATIKMVWVNNNTEVSLTQIPVYLFRCNYSGVSDVDSYINDFSNYAKDSSALSVSEFVLGADTIYLARAGIDNETFAWKRIRAGLNTIYLYDLAHNFTIAGALTSIQGNITKGIGFIEVFNDISIDIEDRPEICPALRRSFDNYFEIEELAFEINFTTQINSTDDFTVVFENTNTIKRGQLIDVILNRDLYADRLNEIKFYQYNNKTEYDSIWKLVYVNQNMNYSVEVAQPQYF